MDDDIGAMILGRQPSGTVQTPSIRSSPSPRKSASAPELVSSNDLETGIATHQSLIRDLIPGTPSHQAYSHELAEMQGALAQNKKGNYLPDSGENTPVLPASTAPPAPAQTDDPIGAMILGESNAQPSKAAYPEPARVRVEMSGVGNGMPQDPTRQADLAARETPLTNVLHGAASLADNVWNTVPGVVGSGVYALERAGGASVPFAKDGAETIAGWATDPFGKAFGIQNTPGYKNEASRQAMNWISQNVGLGADKISQATGIPKDDVENMIGSLTAAAPGAVGGVWRGAKAAPGAVSDAASQLRDSFSTKIAPERIDPPMEAPGAPTAASVEPQVPMPQTSFGSAGAAATTPATTIAELRSQSSPALQAKIDSTASQHVNANAVQMSVLEDKHGINLTKGQRTGDVPTAADEFNNRGAHPDTLGRTFNEQPKQVASALDNVRDTVSPDVHDYGANAIGQQEINGFVKNDAARVANIDSLYQNLKDEYQAIRQKNGMAPTDQIPVDGNAFVKNATDSLHTEMLQHDVPDSIKATLNDIQANGGQMTFNQFLKLNQRLGAKMAEGTGSERAAAFVIRQELQKLPLTGDAAALKPLADQAIAAAKERFNTIQNVPGYAKAVKEAVSPQDAANGIGSASADTFHNTYVSKGSAADIQRMVNELGKGSEAHQAMAAGEIELLKKKAGVTSDNIDLKPKAFNDHLYNQSEKLQSLYGSEGVKSLSEINALTNAIGQPKTGVFNHSNSTSAALAQMAKTGAESWLAFHTAGASVPLVHVAKSMLSARKDAAYGRNAVAPYSGVSIKD